MKISLWSIGKTTEKYLAEGIQLYLRRLVHYTRIQYEEIKDVKPGITGEETSRREADVILSRMKPDDILVLLDENGRSLTSEKLALYIERHMNQSQKHLIFLIGGAFGHHDILRQKASDAISLSPMTFTHQMVRLLFTEQLYRAFTIIKNEKYHNP